MLYGIQVFRAIAALLVVFFHSAGNLAKEKYFGTAAQPIEQTFWFAGEAGVAFFFVLSGFIIHRVHYQDFDRPDRIWNYVKKRVIRIYPTYIVIFFAVFVAAKMTPSLRDTVESDPIIIIKSLLLLPQDFNVVGGTGAPVIVAAWSLQYEMVFYAIFALALIRRWVFYFLGLLCILNVAVEPYMGPYEFPRSFIANHLIVLFGMGVVVSALLKRGFLKNCSGWSVSASALFFLLIAVIATEYRENYHKPSFDFMYGVAASFLIFSSVRFEEKVGEKFQFKFLMLVGDASYAMYLMHFPLVVIFSKIAVILLPINTLGACVAFLFFVIGSVAAALVFNLLVERPLMRYFGKSQSRSSLQDTQKHLSSV